VAELSQTADDFQTVAPWQHDVEDEKVEGLRLSKEEAILARRRDGDRVLFAFQPMLDGSRQLGFVFNDQNSHWFQCKAGPI
jgi:hypothetical protein